MSNGRGNFTDKIFIIKLKVNNIIKELNVYQFLFVTRYNFRFVCLIFISNLSVSDYHIF